MTTDGRGGALRRALAAIGLLGLGAGSVALVGGGGAETPAAGAVVLPLEDLPVADDAVLDDGLHHYVVEVPDEPTASTGVGSDDEVPPPATDPGDQAGEDGVTEDGVTEDGVTEDGVTEDGVTEDGVTGQDALPPTIALGDLGSLGGRVDHLDGDGDDELVAVLEDGTRIPIRSATTPTTEPPAPEGLAALTQAASTREVRPIGGGFHAVSSTLEPDAFASLAEDLDLRTTEDVVVHASADDEYDHLLWALDNPGGATLGGVLAVEDVDVDGTEARDVERGGGVIVAVIDSGVSTTHPDLGDLWVNVDEDCTNGVDDDANGYVDDCRGWDFYNRDNTPDDAGVDNSHGTHVAGTIAAVPDNRIGVAGLAPGVSVMNLKALQNGSTWMSTTAEAVRYAVDNGASVINASWGSSGATREQLPGLDAAVDHALANGVVIVAAAGNDGADIGTRPTFPAALTQPNVVSVGSHNADGNPSGFSNRGDVEVDLHAPGHYIVSTVPGGYSAKQGTSMAAPHVTAAVALVQAQDPGASVTDVRAAILDTVDRRPSLTGASVTGGSLNAARAIGVEAGVEGAPFEVTVHGLDGLRADVPGRLAVTSVVRDRTIAGSRPVVLRATVLTQVDGVDHGIVDLPVTVDGIEATTDDHAQVVLSGSLVGTGDELARGVRTTVDVALPAGVYALVFELVDAEDPDAAYGPAAVVFAQVDEGTNEGTDEEPGADGPGTTVPGAGDPGTGDPGTSNPGAGPGAGGTDPGPTAGEPTTPAPTGSTPTGPSPGGGTPRPDSCASISRVDCDAPDGSTTTPPTAPATAGGGNPAPPTPTIDPPAGTVQPGSGQPGPGQPGPAPVTTTPVAPPTVTVPATPAPVTRAGMTLLKVSPGWGRTSGGTVVVLHGRNLPTSPTVYVGGTPVRVTRASPTSLVLDMPPGLPGIYDITVVDEYGNRVTLRWAYVYAPTKPHPGDPVVPGPTSPPTFDEPTAPSPTPPPSGSTPPGSTPPSTNPAGGATPDPDSTTPGAPTPTTVAPGGGTSPTTTLPTPPGRPRLVLSEGSTRAVGDHVAHRVVSGSPVDLPAGDWAAHACRRAACGAEIHAWDR